MDATLNALGGLLLRALPTFLLVVALHFYLKFVFFRPLDKVLEVRRQATEGARKAAEASLEKANGQAAGYEAAINEARAGMHREQEEFRRKSRAEQAAAVAAARARSEAAVAQARAQLADDAERARDLLRAESDSLAARIAETILVGRSG